ncbi:MAG: adenosylmethionine--8-amino-7-oxononanoate transaminase [Polyangiaceae bacterium]
MDRAEIVALDKAHVWHPYTPMRRYIDETDPLVVARAAGARLYDADGKSYIDANSSWWVALLGHGHPRLVSALRAQSERLCHVALAGVTHEGAATLAARLAARAPAGLDHVFFSDDGSTALEAAIKMAVKLFHNEGKPEKTRFVALGGAFHGETVGVTSLLGIDVFRRPYARVVMECVHVPSPARDPRALDAALALLEREHATIAAIVVEPLVQGADGMRMYDPGYLTALRARARELDVLFVADEVFTGYGRTGSFWACDQAGVSPDILCTAKGFSGGILPMAATLASKRVFDAFLGDPARAFFYGHSYAGHPLGCAVALAVLDVYEEERVLEGVAERSARIAAAFERIQAAHPTVARDARSLGMIGAIDLAPDASYLGEIGQRVQAAARRRGAYLRPLGDVVYVAPPLNIPLADLDELLDIVERSVRDAIS